MADAAGDPAGCARRRTAGRSATVATATADFRDQYYGLVPHVSATTATGPPLVTSGLIERRPVRRGASGRHASPGARFDAPRVRVDRLRRAAAGVGRSAGSCPRCSWPRRRASIEAVVDADGAWLPSVPVVTVTPHEADDLWRVGAVLCAPAASAWAAATYLGAALAADGHQAQRSPGCSTLPLRRAARGTTPRRRCVPATSTAARERWTRAYGTDLLRLVGGRAIVSRRSR